jgi:hypothetical protein
VRRFLTASALFALALVTATVSGQPQADPKSKPDDKKAPVEKAAPKPADSTDAAIAAALANDPDVKMARAKIQLAEAELAKARQVVTLRVVTLKAKIDQLKKEVAAAQDRVALVTRAVQAATVPQSELLAERDKLEAAKGALAMAEAEWKLLTGGATPAIGAATDSNDPRAIADMLAWLLTHPAQDETSATILGLLAARERESVKGPIPDRIRAALDKPVRLGAKGEKVTFEKALEVFKKDAGLDVPVRGTYPNRPVFDPKKPNEVQNKPIELVSEGEELPVGAWFQLFEDSAIFWHRSGTTPQRFSHRFYVREYGLLISSDDTAPPDALLLAEFWKQKPAPKK